MPMISNNAELYDAVKSVSHKLLQAGETQWSSSLEEALSISTVPGEIWGATRFQLRQLRSSDVSKHLGLQQRLDEILRVLDSMLGPVS